MKDPRKRPSEKVIRLTVTGAPRTKKNSRQHWTPKGSRRGMVPVPSKAWQAWCNSARIGIELDSTEGGKYVWGLPRLYSIAPISEPVNCAAIFYRDRLAGDAVGYYQGLADLLEKHGVLEDDKWIVSWDGSRLDKDAENPRTEVTLTILTEDQVPAERRAAK